MNIVFRECTIKDLHTLQEFSYKTFNDAFNHLNTPSNMKAYLEKAFNICKMRAELLNPNSRFYFLNVDDGLVGYLKLNDFKAQTDIHDPKSLEIERIYILSEHQGKGLGGILLNKVAEIAAAQKKEYLWLGVWEKNDLAIRFYQKNGFYETGRHSFFIGAEEQMDYIMRKDLIS